MAATSSNEKDLLALPMAACPPMKCEKTYLFTQPLKKMAATSSNEKDLLALPLKQDGRLSSNEKRENLFIHPASKKMAAPSSNEKDLLALPLKQDGRLSSNEKRGNYLFALLRKKHFFFGMQAGS